MLINIIGFIVTFLIGLFCAYNGKYELAIYFQLLSTTNLIIFKFD